MESRSFELAEMACGGLQSKGEILAFTGIVEIVFGGFAGVLVGFW